MLNFQQFYRAKQCQGKFIYLLVAILSIIRCNCSTTGDTGIGYVHAFFNWLSYCDQIITASQESLGNALCENIHEIFLSASLLPKLLKK